MRYSKNTVKTASRNILLSLLVLSTANCSIPPTYSREEITQVIKDICRDEFELNVKVWESGGTVWIYAPLEKVVGPEGGWDENAVEDLRKISLSLIRVFLNMEKPPDFYCLIISDIKDRGIDIYTIEFIPDRIKFQMGLISLKERQERTVFESFENPQALGDTEGKHIPALPEITLGKFISYLVKQNLQRKFAYSEIKDNFQINELRSEYEDKTLRLVFNIETEEAAENLPDPFTEAENIIRRILTFYDSPRDIVEIEITDTLNGVSRRYTKKALLEGMVVRP